MCHEGKLHLSKTWNHLLFELSVFDQKKVKSIMSNKKEMMKKRLEQGFLFLDGATGTVLQSLGMKAGARPEDLNIEDPSLIRQVHKGYIQAGSQVVYANTFGASAVKLAGSKYSVKEVIEAAVQIVKEETAGTDVLCALDVGPLGLLMEPMGSLSFEQAYGYFKEIVIAGTQAGADLIVFETMSDLYEVKAALLAAKENSDLPVFVTMSFEENGRTFTGCTIESFGMTASALGADAIGMNCSTGPDAMADKIARLASVSSVPVIAKPNAGLPDPISGVYDMDPETYARCMKDCKNAGASVLGGCCGTHWKYMEALVKAMEKEEMPLKKAQPLPCVCTPLNPVIGDDVCPVGERINPTGKKRMQQALLEKDMNHILRTALEQKEAGARILDVNVGYPGVNEEEMLPFVVQTLQKAVDLPLMLDSSNTTALEKALRIYNGKPVINSVNAKQESMNAVLPLAKHYGAAVVGLCLDEDGIPETASKRIALAKVMESKAAELGIAHEDLWIDTLCLTVSAQQNQAMETLKALRWIHHEMGLPCVLGVSNISFGLPLRNQITQTFLCLAMEEGLRFPIINVNLPEMMAAVRSFQVLHGYDAQSRHYIETYAPLAQALKEAQPAVVLKAAASATDPDLKDSKAMLMHNIVQGLDQEAADCARVLLSENTLTPLQIVETCLIPALDETGKKFEAGTMYLPQLLAAASASQAVFEVLKEEMAKSGSQKLDRGTIILATVHGDVHDIGKNIVKTVLENYGFDIIDLGKDVPAQTIADAALQHGVKMVGLSALMTTTLPAMEETTRLLKQLDNPPKVMVGGAVVTQEYADSIGADFYAKDASESAAFAREVFQV